MFLSARASGRMLAAIGLLIWVATAEARVTQSVQLCIRDSRFWDTSDNQRALERFAADVLQTAKSNKQPEALLISSVFPQGRVEARAATLSREAQIVHRLRVLGIESTRLESLADPRSSPPDLGCPAQAVAIEIEAIFWHPRY